MFFKKNKELKELQNLTILLKQAEKDLKDFKLELSFRPLASSGVFLDTTKEEAVEQLSYFLLFGSLCGCSSLEDIEHRLPAFHYFSKDEWKKIGNFFLAYSTRRRNKRKNSVSTKRG